MGVALLPGLAGRLDPVGWIAVLLICTSTFGCSRAANTRNEPNVITVLMWMPGDANSVDERLVREFTTETGISIRVVPGSESASQRLKQELTLLENSPSAVDVFEIDTIWPGIVGKYMLDLKSTIAGELSDELPQVIENATIGGRLTAAPFLVEYGMLYYRTDLLKKYGFAHPPRTWDELEIEARRIQRGERMAGKPDFWGYVWQGANYEGLTCNALEWQVSEGGRNVLEPDHTVNVDNPHAVRAFYRAAQWVGNISPRGVTEYLEEDSRNTWEAGGAAFMRNWSYVYHLSKKSPEISNRFSVAPMPACENPYSSVMGGWYLGVSKETRHRANAVAFVKYMTSTKVQRQRAISGGYLPTLTSLYRDPAVIEGNLFLSQISAALERSIRRPAALAGAEYDLVSRTYASGVHSILTGQVSASKGAAHIQEELVRSTGFAAGASVDLK